MSVPQSCDDYLPLIHLYLDDELSRNEQAELLKHLEHCEACAALMDDYRRLAGEMRALPQTPPPNLHRDIMGYIQKNAPLPWWRRRRVHQSLGAAACAAMVGLVVWFGGPFNTASEGQPPDSTTAAVVASAPAPIGPAPIALSPFQATVVANPIFSDEVLALDTAAYALTGLTYSGVVAAVGDLAALPAFPGWERTILLGGEDEGRYLTAYGIGAREHACTLLADAGFTLYDQLSGVAGGNEDAQADCWVILLAQAR